jgi:Uncharacterized conserved protein (DUF2276).
MMDNTECEICPLRQNCVYARTFEPRATVFDKNNLQVPPPFIINAPAASQPQQVPPGTLFTIEMNVFGTAISWLPILLQAWQHIGKWPVSGKKNMFQLTQVQVLNLEGDSLSQGLPSELNETGKGFIPPKISHADYHELALLTPLRLRQKKRNIDAEALNGELFIKSLYRRYSLLNNNYAESSADLSRLPAFHFPKVQKKLEWTDWQRWSNRQRKSIKLGGLTGTLRLEDNLQPFNEALSYLPWINLGKSCSLGLGRVRIIR